MGAYPNDPFGSFFKVIFGNGGKSVEKFFLYVATTLAATNVFGTVKDGSLREWLTGGLALIIAGLHVSTPTPKSGPNQL